MPTVLVVDDEFAITDLLETILSGEGYRVLTACNGKQGLEKLAQGGSDVILLDFMMPILDGGGMLRALVAMPAYQRIPVIVMSSLSEQMIAQKCEGYVAFLRKPFRVTELLSTVARVLGNRTSNAHC
jgi:CheY-like chemotaxis protein